MHCIGSSVRTHARHGCFRRRRWPVQPYHSAVPGRRRHSGVKVPPASGNPVVPGPVRYQERGGNPIDAESAGRVIDLGRAGRVKGPKGGPPSLARGVGGVIPIEITLTGNQSRDDGGLRNRRGERVGRHDDTLFPGGLCCFL